MVRFHVIVLFMISSLLNWGCKEGDGRTPNETKYASTDGLDWIDIEKASQISEISNKKKFLVDVYTDWCHWCKVMDKQTFTDPEVIKYISDNFHVVKFDAESQRTLNFKGKSYQWQNEGRNGVNGLALELLQGRLSYPSLVYLDEKLNPLAVSPGFKNPEQLVAELRQLK